MPAPAVPAALDGLDVRRPGFYLRDDYFELLAWLRANDPVHRLADGTVLVSTYDLIREVSSHPDPFSSRHGALVNDPLRGAEPNDDAGSLLHLDPPRHAEYRKLLNRQFTPRAAGRLEPAVRRAVTDAFDALPTGVEVDLVAALASPIPVTVIAELLGIADGDRDDFRRWSDATIRITDDTSPEVLTAAAELFVFLDEHVRAAYERPAGDDLLSTLAAAPLLTPDQVRMFCLTLLVAGNETTRTLIAGAAHALHEHPEQRAALAADPSLLPGAVEECLRWVTPIQAFCRTATRATDLGPTRVEAGDYLVLLYASGNRDEAAFGPDAHRFDVTRPPSPAHVAFGFGEHLCLGAALARLEARVVLETLLARHPAYELVAEPTWTPSTLTRSIASMPVRFDPVRS